MAKRRKFANPPYLYLEMRSKGNVVLSVTSTTAETPAPFQTEFGAKIQLPAGADRLAIATTLVEIAKDLLRDAPDTYNRIKHTASEMIRLQMASGDRFVIQPPDDFPF